MRPVRPGSRLSSSALATCHYFIAISFFLKFIENYFLKIQCRGMGTFTVLCNTTFLNLQNIFFTTKENSPDGKQSLCIWPSSKALANPHLLSGLCIYVFQVLHITGLPLGDVFCLASFIEHNVCEVHPHIACISTPFLFRIE